MVGVGRGTAQRFFDIAVRRLVSSISTWNANVDWKRIGMMLICRVKNLRCFKALAL